MHKQFLLAALQQAWLGRGVCSPNPSVGAVAVRDGKIISQAWHRGAGTPHAEQLVLAQLPEDVSHITLYVTLEPCNHWGKTSPCVDAIIARGIQRVVYAYRDPNPVVKANNTPELLSQNGIEVIYHPLPEIDSFYQSYRYWTLTGKPWVTAKIAQSFDGKIAGADGEHVMLSNALCHEFTHQQRLHSDVILTTAQTVNRDDPLLNVRLPNSCASKPVAIVDRQGILNPQAKVLSMASHCHVFHDAQYQIAEPHPACSYHTLPLNNHQLNLEALIRHMGRLGYHDVWVEAGGRLFSALHQAGLVNKTHIYLVPALLGDKATSLYHHAEIFKQPHSLSWQQMGNNMIASLTWQRHEQEMACSRD